VAWIPRVSGISGTELVLSVLPILPVLPGGYPEEMSLIEFDKEIYQGEGN